MDNKFEDFLNENKDAFDSFEPSETMWQRIENRIEHPEKKGLLVSMGARKWMSAAAAVVIIAGAAFLFTRKENTTGTHQGIAKIDSVPAERQNNVPDPVDRQQPLLAENKTPDSDTLILTPIEPKEKLLASSGAELQGIASEELVHYTKLVELKQRQISILRKDEPLLYKQFASDFSKIDEEFSDLKKQKQQHPNSEQLLEAMLQNLRMQSALLNRQLEIVKAINNNKKKRYEKTYNSTL